jgi:predicted lipoprotein
MRLILVGLEREEENGTRLEVLSAVLLYNQVLWGVTPCRLVNSY